MNNNTLSSTNTLGYLERKPHKSFKPLNQSTISSYETKFILKNMNGYKNLERR
jgi:hypothetical protein